MKNAPDLYLEIQGKLRTEAFSTGQPESRKSLQSLYSYLSARDKRGRKAAIRQNAQAEFEKEIASRMRASEEGIDAILDKKILQPFLQNLDPEALVDKSELEKLIKAYQENASEQEEAKRIEAILQIAYDNFIVQVEEMLLTAAYNGFVNEAADETISFIKARRLFNSYKLTESEQQKSKARQIIIDELIQLREQIISWNGILFPVVNPYLTAVDAVIWQLEKSQKVSNVVEADAILQSARTTFEKQLEFASANAKKLLGEGAPFRNYIESKKSKEEQDRILPLVLAREVGAGGQLAEQLEKTFREFLAMKFDKADPEDLQNPPVRILATVITELSSQLANATFKHYKVDAQKQSQDQLKQVEQYQQQKAVKVSEEARSEFQRRLQGFSEQNGDSAQQSKDEPPIMRQVQFRHPRANPANPYEGLVQITFYANGEFKIIIPSPTVNYNDGLLAGLKHRIAKPTKIADLELALEYMRLNYGVPDNLSVRCPTHLYPGVIRSCAAHGVEQVNQQRISATQAARLQHERQERREHIKQAREQMLREEIEHLGKVTSTLDLKKQQETVISKANTIQQADQTTEIKTLENHWKLYQEADAAEEELHLKQLENAEETLTTKREAFVKAHSPEAIAQAWTKYAKQSAKVLESYQQLINQGSARQAVHEAYWKAQNRVAGTAENIEIPQLLEVTHHIQADYSKAHHVIAQHEKEFSNHSKAYTQKLLSKVSQYEKSLEVLKSDLEKATSFETAKPMWENYCKEIQGWLKSSRFYLEQHVQFANVQMLICDCRLKMGAAGTAEQIAELQKMQHDAMTAFIKRYKSSLENFTAKAETMRELAYQSNPDYAQKIYNQYAVIMEIAKNDLALWQIFVKDHLHPLATQVEEGIKPLLTLLTAEDLSLPAEMSPPTSRLIPVK